MDLMLKYMSVVGPVKLRLAPPHRCGTLTHDNHEIVMKPRSCGMTGHREGCKCDPKGKVDND